MPATPSASALGEKLATEPYVASRLYPGYRDLDYVILTDLRLIVAEFAQRQQGKLFDYGCGGSPYRSLFAGCSEYIRADITPGPNIDRLLTSEGRTSEADNAYDVVFSAQVLEHVRNPQDYLAECYRILKPGGRLLVTTHGMYHEHGCPHDFHRWTSNGLSEAFTQCGFKITQSQKFTTGFRAAVQLTNYLIFQTRTPGNPLLSFMLGVNRKLHRLTLPGLNYLAARCSDQSVIPAESDTAMYMGIAVEGVKPA